MVISKRFKEWEKEAKVEEKPEAVPEPKAEEKELSDGELALLFADESFREFATNYLKEKEGRTLQDAAKMWKVESKADKTEVKELKAKVEKLELQLSPVRKTIKESASTKEVSVELSDEQLDAAMAEHVFGKRYSKTW